MWSLYGNITDHIREPCFMQKIFLYISLFLGTVGEWNKSRTQVYYSAKNIRQKSAQWCLVYTWLVFNFSLKRSCLQEPKNRQDLCLNRYSLISGDLATLHTKAHGSQSYTVASSHSPLWWGAPFMATPWVQHNVSRQIPSSGCLWCVLLGRNSVRETMLGKVGCALSRIWVASPVSIWHFTNAFCVQTNPPFSWVVLENVALHCFLATIHELPAVSHWMIFFAGLL